MRLGLIGDGRAARTLAPLLHEAGEPLTWRWRRGDALPITSLEPVDVVLVAVSDDGIAEVASRLAERSSAADEVWLHLSGALPANVLRVTPERPGAVGTLHPMVALPGEGASRQLLHGACCGVAGDAEAVGRASELGELLAMKVVEINEEDRGLYHAAAVSVAGHATALLAQASRMLQAAGFEEQTARQSLASLMGTALDNLNTGPPAEVITGPIARGDVRTVQMHLHALATYDPRIHSTYIHLARTALELSREGIRPEAADAIAALLEDAGPSEG